MITAALLAAAMIGVAQLAQVHSRIRTRADARLSAELIAANQVERLRSVPLERIETAIDQLEAQSSRMPIHLKLGTVQTDAVGGVHVTVSVFAHDHREQDKPLARRHFWRLKAANDDLADAEASQ